MISFAPRPYGCPVSIWTVSMRSFLGFLGHSLFEPVYALMISAVAVYIQSMLSFLSSHGPLTVMLVRILRRFTCPTQPSMSDPTATTNTTTEWLVQTYAHTSLSPIAQLPFELLLEIFSYCVANRPTSPLVLRQVTCLWRQLIDASPSLWHTIALSNTDGTRFSRQQTELWTQMSKPLKFDVELNLDDPDYILPLLAPLLPFTDRWRYFRLLGKREEEIPVHDLHITPESLTHLYLFLHDYDQDDFDDEEPPLNFSPISPGQNVTFGMSISVSKIPSPPTFSYPLRFVHLTIAEGGHLGLHTQPKFVLEFLTSCPELESFYLSGWPHDEPVLQPLPIVKLPNLVSLHLKSTCFARALLSSLDTPRLQNLFLSQLNVEFRLYSYLFEKGDSDDEAQDYSQSPWSDRATGMGLRKLLARCNPPIRTLEMDFCDMRTKDFLHVFDRLSLLEDFHIVASDMSDKVINMLRPMSSNGTMEVRLPHLRKLRLTNCQRLTGKAVTAALISRLHWTDKTSPEYTLNEIVLSGCEGLSLWDRHVLSSEFGPRFRV